MSQVELQSITNLEEANDEMFDDSEDGNCAAHRRGEG
jgi:hypothetical protein